MLNKTNPYLEKSRLEMFCDGVFAIAITLLVLEIKIPKHTDLHEVGGLGNYLLKIWPSYFSYIITFISIGIYWSNHHWLFSFIKRTNHVFNLLNILFLMSIAFMPFSTAVLGDFILDPVNRNAAITTYCIGYLLPIPCTVIIFLYAAHNGRLLDDGLSSKFVKNLKIKLFAGLLFGSISVIASFIYPIVSLIFIGVGFVVFLLPPETPMYNEVVTKNEVEL